MRKHYDFSRGKPNPYAKALRTQITIRLERRTVDYFKRLATETGISYQTLINLYLRECAGTGKRLELEWAPRKPRRVGARGAQ